MLKMLGRGRSLERVVRGWREEEGEGGRRRRMRGGRGGQRGEEREKKERLLDPLNLRS